LTGTFPDVFHRRAGPRAYVRDRLIRTLSNEVACTRAYVSDGLVCALSNQLTGTFSDVFDSRVHTFTHQPAGARAHVFHGGTDALYQFLHDLGVAVYGR